MQSIRMTAEKKHRAKKSLLVIGKNAFAGAIKKYQAETMLITAQKIDGHRLVRKAAASTAGKKQMNGNPVVENKSSVAKRANSATMAIDVATA